MFKSTLVMTAVVAILGTGAMADIFMDPNWDVSGPYSTRTVYEFDDSNRTPSPDSEYNLFGSASATVTNGWWAYYFGAPSGWQPGEPGQGVWVMDDQTAKIEVVVPNCPGGPHKYIWIQLTWFSNVGGSPTITVESADDSDSTSTPVYDQTFTVRDSATWHHSAYMLELVPNPDVETITITGLINVDELVIDTFCPEPATLTVLGLGGVMALVRRKR